MNGLGEAWDIYGETKKHFPLGVEASKRVLLASGVNGNATPTVSQIKEEIFSAKIDE